MEKTMKYFSEVVEEADLAFWAVVAESYPEVKTGDFPPDAFFALNRAEESAVKTWLQHNSEG